MRWRMLLAAALAVAGCTTSKGGRVVAHQDRGVRQDLPPLHVEHLGAGYLLDMAQAEGGDAGDIPPGGVLVVNVVVDSSEHANPENFLVTVEAGDRELLEAHGPPMSAKPCGYGCGPTTGLGEVRRRAPCYCAGFTVELPELADRYAVTIADAVDRARFDFTVHTELAGGTTRGEASSIYSRSRP